MEEKFYLGDLVLRKGTTKTISIYFLGSENIDNNRWKVNFSFSYSNTNSGHGANMYLVLSKGEKVRFGEGFKGYESKNGILGKKREYKEVKIVQFIDIERDHITLKFLEEE